MRHIQRIAFVNARLGPTLSRAVFLTFLVLFVLTASAYGQVQTVYTFSQHAGHLGVIQGRDGLLYGTDPQNSNDFGTLYRIATAGTGFTQLHAFLYSSPFGANPTGSVIQGNDGYLYGTTYFTGNDCCGAGSGTVYRIAPAGNGFLTLHVFVGTDGANPAAGLTQGSDGFLYGTTRNGGVGGKGTVYRLAPDGSGFSTLHAFTVAPDGTSPDGAHPVGGLVQARDGYLYGTTQYGGMTNTGTIFRIGTNGGGFSRLHSFDIGLAGANNGGTYPSSRLIQGSDDYLYGTAPYGGAPGVTRYGSPDGRGTVYRIRTDGSGFTALRLFMHVDGAYPQGGIIEGSDGHLYGTTQHGGRAPSPGDTGNGSVYKIARDGSSFSTLHAFSHVDGSEPTAGVIQASDGNLYGTTNFGGGFSLGTIFRLAPPVSGQPTAISAVSGAGTYGGTGTLTATLGGANPLAGQPISFLVNGVQRGTASTDGAGVATLPGVALTGLNAGTHPMEARFAASGANLASNATGVLTVAKATPVVTWNQPADLTYGTPLGATQLNAAANVAGTFTYTPPAGTVLNVGFSSLSATFAPSYTGNYDSAVATTTINVNKATATVALSNLTQTYTGSPLTPTVTTTPPGLAVTWTGAPQTNAGSYSVTATVNHPNYQGSASGTFVITGATSPAVSIQDLMNVVNGMGLPKGVTTSLTAPLKEAADLLNDGNPTNDRAVCGKLGAFVNQVKAKTGNGQLSPAQGDRLLRLAQEIETALGC